MSEKTAPSAKKGSWNSEQPFKPVPSNPVSKVVESYGSINLDSDESGTGHDPCTG